MQIKVERGYRVRGSEHGEEKVEAWRIDLPPRGSAETSSSVRSYLFKEWIAGRM